MTMDIFFMFGAGVFGVLFGLDLLETHKRDKASKEREKGIPTDEGWVIK